VKLLLAGAAEAWTISPMIGEARCAMALARAIGVADRLRCVTGIGEELPFADAVFDAVYSGGCVHHMTTQNAVPEAARILRPGGVFAAVEPWRAPPYAIGTKFLGKRESVHCRPLTEERVAPLRSSFAKVRVVRHGTLTRYPLLALEKLGLRCALTTVWRIHRGDDALCSLVPGLRRWGSCAALLAMKERSER
jgi:SAM-dependent methyltransferase